MEMVRLGYTPDAVEENPTGGLRWVQETGRLQQEWFVMQCRAGKTSAHREWRDVPIVSLSTQEPQS